MYQELHHPVRRNCKGYPAIFYFARGGHAIQLLQRSMISSKFYIISQIGDWVQSSGSRLVSGGCGVDSDLESPAGAGRPFARA